VGIPPAGFPISGYLSARGEEDVNRNRRTSEERGKESMKDIRTIRDLIENRARYSSDRECLLFGDKRITYGEFDRQINRVANGFLRLGIRRNDKICLLLPNGPEFLLAWFGLNKIGAVMVPINTAFRGQELSYIIRHSEASLVVTAEEFLPPLADVKRDAGYSRIIHTGAHRQEGLLRFRDFCDGESDCLAPFPLSEDDHAVFPYTSGTTGSPKGVMLSHRSYVQTGFSYAEAIGATAKDRIMTPNPLFHINAQCYSTLGSLAAGASLVLLERFSASRIVSEIELYKPTILVLVLASATILYNRYKDDPDRHTSLRKIIAGGVPKGEYRNFEKKFGVALQNIYSMTETPLGIMGPRDDAGKDGGVGLPMPVPAGYGENVIRIVDERGQDTASGEIGEIIVKNAALMDGYFKDPEATRQALRNGFLHTGDRAIRDEEGYIFFVGRGRDILRKKGHNIAAAEVEGVLHAHAGVLEAAVIGVPSSYGDDEIKAFIVLRDGHRVDEEELRQWCSARLAEYKVPRFMEVVTALPKNAMGRVMKNQLQK
jgi:carnitine-CoA ligase